MGVMEDQQRGGKHTVYYKKGEVGGTATARANVHTIDINPSWVSFEQ